MIEEPNIITKSIYMRYGRIDYIASDAPIGLAVSQYGEWADLEIQSLCAFITPGSTVVDVGANIGTHTLAFARRVGLEGSVFAFEPQPAVFKILEKNINSNNLTNVRAVLAGVGSVAGEMVVPPVDYNQRTNIGAVQLVTTYGDGTEARTQIVPIDDYHLPACRLVKVDAEGMDAAVVAGLANTIATLRPVVAVECNDVDSGVAIIRANKWLDYKLFLLRAAAFNPNNFNGNHDNIFGVACESSLLFVPNEYLDLVPSAQPGLELVLISDLDSLAVAVIETPRYGDETAYDRSPSRLRDEIQKITRENELLIKKHRDELESAKEEAGRFKAHLQSVGFELSTPTDVEPGTTIMPPNLNEIRHVGMTGMDYIATHFQSVDGLVSETSVYFTELFMAAQRDLGIEGVNLEIGVWRGKYLASSLFRVGSHLLLNPQQMFFSSAERRFSVPA